MIEPRASTPPTRVAHGRQDGNDGGIARDSFLPAKTPPAPEVRADAVTQLRHALLQVHDYLPELAGEVDALASGRDQLNVIRSDLSALLRTIDTMVIEAAGHSRAKFQTGIGEVQVRQGMERSGWQSEELLHAIFMQTFGQDMERPVKELVAALEAEVRACAPFTKGTGWRVTALRERGIDPADWCDENPAGLTVQWPKGEQ